MSLKRRFVLSVVLLAILYSVGAAGYAVLEDVPPFDALYMTAITLSTVGFSERSAEARRMMRRERILHVRGDATEEEMLLQAGLMRCDALVAALPHDADSLYVTLTAHGLRPDMTIIARAEQPRTGAKLVRAGATKVVCPQVVGANKIANFLTRPNVVDLIEFAGKGIELEMDEYVVEPDAPSCNATLRTAPIRERADAIVVAIKRQDGPTIYHPDPDERMLSGDTLIMIGRTGVSQRLQQLESPV